VTSSVSELLHFIQQILFSLRFVRQTLDILYLKRCKETSKGNESQRRRNKSEHKNGKKKEPAF